MLPKCLRPWTGFELDDSTENWLDVRPCCWAKIYLGNLQRESLRNIWNGKKYQQFRNSMLSGDISKFCPEDCPNLTNLLPDHKIYFGDLNRSSSPNHHKNYQEILSGSAFLTSSPLYIKVTPTLACNLDCIMCYQNHNAKYSISKAVEKEIFSVLEGVQMLQVQGGEIFASTRGINFLKSISQLESPPSIGLITNGSFPARGSWDILKQLRYQWILVSIDSTSVDTYSRIRRQGNFDNVLSNLQKLNTIRQSHFQSFPIYLGFVLMSLNYEEALSALQLAQQLGIDVMFSLLTYQNFTKCWDLQCRMDILDHVVMSLKLALEYAVENNLNQASTSLSGVLEILKRKY